MDELSVKLASSNHDNICRDSNCPRAVVEHEGGWYITMMHPGYNSPANNSQGYANARAARAAIRRYAQR